MEKNPSTKTTCNHDLKEEGGKVSWLLGRGIYFYYKDDMLIYRNLQEIDVFFLFKITKLIKSEAFL